MVEAFWIEESQKLTKQFTFKDFSEAIAFTTRVALLSEKYDHHPEIFISWNKVKIYLCTHDNGNQITEKDHALAQKIDQLL